MVGVCIKYKHENYGGILQAYATVQYLEKNHIAYELIQYTRKKTLTETIRDIPRLFNPVWLNSRSEGIQRKISLKMNPDYAKQDAIRMEHFQEFKKWAFHNFSKEHIGFADLCKGSEKYSAVITGSDQLWSPAGLPSNYYNLMFVPDRILKISVASSFGVKKIPWYQKKRTRHFLERIPYISMRENRGSEIVQELTGRSVPTILDPVFFLSKEEWLIRIPNERKVPEPYIFAYFLGKNAKHRKAVEKLAEETGLKIVALRHMDQYVPEDETFGDVAPYDVDPRMFLNLLRNAEYVCTDSFHGTAFSIINEKQFIVFDRYNDKSGVSKNTRIDTICQNLGLETRRYTSAHGVLEIARSKIDYNEIAQKLVLQRQTTNKYMSEVLAAINKSEQSV